VSEFDSSEVRMLIFDWDGTLMDSADQIVHCMQLAADECKVVIPTREAVEAIIGLGLPEALAILFPDLSDIRRHLIRTRYAWHFVEGTGGESRLFPGVPELLRDFKTKGYRMVIATGKSRLGLDRVLVKTGLTNFFHATRCADETLSKPHPKMLHELLALYKMEPHHAIMIGDTTYDMEMAQRIGMPRLAVSYGVHTVGELQRFEPLAVVGSIEEMRRYLDLL
jgi:phosphoglycolate phosphatase